MRLPGAVSVGGAWSLLVDAAHDDTVQTNYFDQRWEQAGSTTAPRRPGAGDVVAAFEAIDIVK